MTLNEVNAVLL